MRALGLVIVLVCVACAKKPSAKAPTSAAPPSVERTDSESAPQDEKKPAPTSTKKPGDPCSGGE